MKTDTSVVFSLLLSLFYTVNQSPYPYCIPTVSPLYPHCTPLYPNCTPTVPSLPHCIPTVPPLYPHYIPTVSPLYTHYIHIYPVLHCDQTVRNPPKGVLEMKSIQCKTTFIITNLFLKQGHAVKQYTCIISNESQSFSEQMLTVP